MAKVFIKEGKNIYRNGYEIKKQNGILYCNCKAWQFLGGPIHLRRCKHIKENVRMTPPKPKKPTNTNVAKYKRLVKNIESLWKQRSKLTDEKNILESQTVFLKDKIDEVYCEIQNLYSMMDDLWDNMSISERSEMYK